MKKMITLVVFAAVVFTSAVKAGTLYTWVGTSGNFEDSANWDPATGYPISADDSAVITNHAVSGSVNVVTVNNPLTIGRLEVGGGGAGKAQLVFKNGLSTNVVSGDVYVYSGATLTHTLNGGSTPNYKLNLRVGGNMSVENGAYVNVDSLGYLVGPGSNVGGNGGAYGGKGWRNGTVSYGSIREPTDLGSGGATGSTKYGGGAVMLDVAGTLTVNGVVSACGKIASGGSGGCGGSGGSVFVKCGTLAGGGTIRADHSSEYLTATYSGAGGRVALHQRTATDWSAFTGKVTAYNGNSGQSNQSGPGTIFRKHAGQTYGDLVILGSNVDTLLSAAGAYCICDISTSVIDRDIPFDNVAVSNNVQLLMRSGVALKVAGTIDTRNGRLYSADTTAGIEFIGSGDSYWLGCANSCLYKLTCTVPGKNIYFGTTSSDKLVIPGGGVLTLQGDENNALNLLPLVGASKWTANVNANATTDIKYIAVSNSNASAGATVLAIDSKDLGGNSYWAFSGVIVPGQFVVWTGANSTDWLEGANWDIGRVPVATDVVTVRVSESGKYPIMPAGDYILNRLTVESGASLTMSSANVTVTNALSVKGSLTCSGSEVLTLSGDADFSGGAFTCNSSKVVLAGGAVQSVNPGGLTYNKFHITKTGGSVTFGAGFTAAQFRADVSAAVSLVFAAGSIVEAAELFLNGLSGTDKLLTISSSAANSAWYLKATADRQRVTGVLVSDCNALPGAKIIGGASSVDLGGNDNWDFVTVTADWTGGAGTTDFATAANWSPAAVPGDGAWVTILAADGGSATVVLPANHPVSMGKLTLGASGGTVKFIANSPIAVTGFTEIKSGTTLVLNYYVSPNIVSNDFVIRSGGKLTHDQLKKLNLSVVGNMTVESGGYVDADSMGCAPGQAPPGITKSSATASGTYGGHPNAAHPCYGSVFNPTDWGCGGGNTKYGGGVVMIDVTGRLAVNGIVTACSWGGGGGGGSGSGGSILIKVGTLSGTGKISASAVSYGRGSSEERYTGSGGRIALYQRTATDWSGFTGEVVARSGKPSTVTGGSAAESCGPGTIYRQAAGDGERGGTITVNTYETYGYADLPRPEDGNSKTAYRNAALVIESGTVAITNSTWDCASDRVKFRDINLTSVKSKLELRGSTVHVVEGTHRDGRDWGDAYANLVTEAGGAIIWDKGFMILIQ